MVLLFLLTLFLHFRAKSNVPNNSWAKEVIAITAKKNIFWPSSSSPLPDKKKYNTHHNKSDTCRSDERAILYLRALWRLSNVPVYIACCRWRSPTFELPFKYSPSPVDHWALTADKATESTVFTTIIIAMSKPHDASFLGSLNSSEMKKLMKNIHCDFEKCCHFFLPRKMMISLLRISLKVIN